MENFHYFGIAFLGFIFLAYIASLYAPKKSISTKETDFGNLLGYLKFILTVTITCIGLIIGLFAFFFWEDKEQLVAQSSEAIKKVKENANSRFDSLESDVYSQVDAELDKIFKTPKIQKLVEKKARELAEKKVESIVAEKVVDIKRDIDIVSQIDRAALEMKNNHKMKAMFKLQELYRSDSNPETRERAKKELDEICNIFFNKDLISHNQIYPDSIKNDFLKTYKENSILLNVHNWSISGLQSHLNQINTVFGTYFNVCEIREFEKWAKAKEIPFSIDYSLN